MSVPQAGIAVSVGKMIAPLDIPSRHRYRAVTKQRKAIMQNLTGRHYFYFGYYFYFAGLPAVC